MASSPAPAPKNSVAFSVANQQIWGNVQKANALLSAVDNAPTAANVPPPVQPPASLVASIASDYFEKAHALLEKDDREKDLEASLSSPTIPVHTSNVHQPPKIVEYYVHLSDKRVELHAEINDRLKSSNGWQPLGACSVAVDHGQVFYFQTMVRYA